MKIVICNGKERCAGEYAVKRLEKCRISLRNNNKWSAREYYMGIPVTFFTSQTCRLADMMQLESEDTQMDKIKALSLAMIYFN